MKIIYLIAALYRPAGMERVLANKANWLCRQGHDVLVVTTDQKGRDVAFPLEKGIRTIDLGIGYEDNNGGSFADKLLHFPGKQRRHRKRLTELLCREKADIVISMFCNDAAFVPKIKDGSRKVLEVHFSRYKRLQYGRSGIWALADRIMNIRDGRTARGFDAFVVLTQEDKCYWGDMPNIHVIPNARAFRPDHPALLTDRQVLAVGRYTAQKNFKDLIAAWRMIDTQGWCLRIAGEGDSFEDIPYNVITGPSEDIMSEYMHSSVVALSSLYEGLPMVLLEAQACGLPVVSYSCKCGPRDVITDGMDGYLVPVGNVVELARRLSSLMKSAEDRKRMGAAAYAASDRFDQEKIMQLWMNLFERLL